MEQILLVSVVLLGLVVAFNLLLTLAVIRRLNTDRQAAGVSTPTGPPVGQPAPPFAATTLTGAPVTLAAYAGRPLALLVISPTCGPCWDALPRSEALGPQAAQAGVALVLVSTADGAATQAFVDEFHVQLPVLVAPQATNPFMRDYSFDSTPSYCLIDAQGRVESAGYPSLVGGDWLKRSRRWADAARSRATLVPHPGGGDLSI